MRARIVKIGNSQGIRIPKPILEQIGAGEDVELEVEDGQIIIRPSANPRQGWDEAFKRMAESGDDTLLTEGDEAIRHSWDDEEWRW
jgi:antitoxin MazE